MSADIIGSLRHHITIERPFRSAEAGGTATIVWEAVASVFARIESVGGREIAIADGMAARITHRVLMRYRADVGAQNRFVVGSRILELRAVLDLEGRQRWLQCLCEERLP